jgi:hypothetical protein
MHDTAIISELRAALRRQGVWGPRAERLMHDWQEHVEEDTAQRVENGAGPDAAREVAWQALGSSNVLAAKAASELASGSWLGRHPWMGGLVLPLAGWVILICATFLFFGGMMELLGGFDALDTNAHAVPFRAMMVCWLVTINWLPWLAAMTWLARIAVRMPGGWKLYWITAIALTAFAPSIWAWVHWPQHGPHSGSFSFQLIGLPGLVSKVVFQMLGYGAMTGSWGEWFRGVCQHPMPLIQTATMALGAVAFYGRMSGGYRRAVTHPAAIALFLIVAVVGVGFVRL